MSTSNASRVLLTGSFWVGVSEVLVTLVDMARQIVAARVLAPQDFGLMGIVLLYMAVLDTITKTGFEQALIQRREGAEKLLDVAWSWQAARGVVLAGALAAAAPALAAWYKLPLLKPLIWVSVIHVILGGLHSVGLWLFTRALNFRTLSIINVIRAAAQAGVAIPAIVIRGDVWGLVIGLCAGSAVSLLVSYLAHPYRPRLDFDWQKIRALSSYGKWITGATIVVFVVVQGDDLFVSRYLGPTALAFYVFAYDFANLPTTKISHVLGRVAFPTYARMQENKADLRAAFMNTMRATMLLSTPLSVVLWVVIPDVVEHIVGAKWQPVIPLVRVLVIAAWVRSFAALAGPLFQACHRPDLDFKMNLPRFFVTVGLIWPACAFFGLEGACWVVVLAIVTCLPTWFYGVRKLIGVSLSEVLRGNALALASTVALAGSIFLCRLVIYGAAWRQLASLVAGLLLWLAVMGVLDRTTPLRLFGELARLRAMLKPNPN